MVGMCLFGMLPPRGVKLCPCTVSTLTAILQLRALSHTRIVGQGGLGRVAIPWHLRHCT